MALRLPTAIRCCWSFPLHQGYFFIAYADILKIIVGVIYVSSLLFESDRTTYEVLLLIVIAIVIVIEACAAYFSLRKGFRFNDWRKHLIYLYTKLIFIITALPSMLVVDQNRCYYFSASNSSCSTGNILVQGFLSIMEVYFAYIIYSIHKKTLEGYYGPFGSSPCLALTSRPSIFKKYFPAIIIEVKGAVVNVKADKHSFKQDIRLPLSQRKANDANNKENQGEIIIVTEVLKRKSRSENNKLAQQVDLLEQIGYE